MSYPEHDKLAAVRDKSQAIGEFLDTALNEWGLTLARYDDDHYDGAILMPDRSSIQDLLARFFGIDRLALEAEKIQMLEEMRTGLSDG